MVAIEQAKFNGAELVAELVKTGTGDEHLKPARAVLAFLHRVERRIATANEIIDALESAGVTDAMLAYPRTPPLTIQKARALAEFGKWEGADAVRELSVEEKILTGQKLPEEAPKTVLEKMGETLHPGEGCEEKSPLAAKANPRGRPKTVRSDRPAHAEPAAA